jgi:hypothetical protein
MEDSDPTFTITEELNPHLTAEEPAPDFTLRCVYMHLKNLYETIGKHFNLKDESTHNTLNYETD